MQNSKYRDKQNNDTAGAVAPTSTGFTCQDASLRPDCNLSSCGEDKLCQETVKLEQPYRFSLVLLTRNRLGEGLPSPHPLTPTVSQLHLSDHRFSRPHQDRPGNAGKLCLVHLDQTGHCSGTYWNNLTI